MHALRHDNYREVGLCESIQNSWITGYTEVYFLVIPPVLSKWDDFFEECDKQFLSPAEDSFF
jgi:hypothetical protein